MEQTAATMPAPGLSGLKAAAPRWWPVVLGMLILYVPTFYDMANGIWSTEEQAHGPIILGLALWLLYRNWMPMLAASAGVQPSYRSGWAVLVVGLLAYIAGRSQGILIFELGSFLWLLTATILLMCGARALRVQWFPLFFMLFMLPLPGDIVSALTLPMKMAVSYVTEHVLYALGFPIARMGVILQIGQYQLMVADACAGLQTLLTLESLGLFYLNVVRHTSALRNTTLALLIIPISFTANVIRVMTLTLITYYFGDAAGQGFLHGFAGMVLFISALVLIIGLDTLLQWIVALRQRRAKETSL
ncbi:exosortase B [Duganella vulcania]|nr:exosortase B [Duganella vulcania]